MTAIFPPVTKKLAERLKGKCGPLHPERTLFVYKEPWAPGAIVTLTLIMLMLLAVLVSTAIDVVRVRFQHVPSFPGMEEEIEIHALPHPNPTSPPSPIAN